MKRTDPELIRELAGRVDYNPETGEFTWKADARKYGKTVYPGKRAGNLAPHGYYRLSIRNTKVSAHIVAWYIVYGEIPDLPIDHINQVKSDNRISNLRVATLPVNFYNSVRAHPNKTGFTGVVKVGRKYQARIYKDNKSRHLGTFERPEDAGAVYEKEKDRVFSRHLSDLALQSEER